MRLSLVCVLVSLALTASGPSGLAQTFPAASDSPLLAVPQDTVEPNAGEEWFDGMFTSQYGTNCSVYGSSYTEIMVQASVGYWGRADVTYPRVGEGYYGRILLSIPGIACPDGIQLVTTDIALPADTYFNQSQSNPIQCWYQSANTNGWVNVTNDPDAGCPVNPTNLGNGFSSLGYRRLVNGMMFQIIYPIYSTKVRNGISDTQAKMTAKITSTAATTDAYPYQWVWVAANSPSITYPAPSTINITNTTARNQATVWNHYTPGNAYFDIGPTAAYGATSAPIAIAGTYDGANVVHDWGSMVPGTIYHWRMRFVHAGGTTTGADQTFTTTGTPPVAVASDDFSGDGKSDLIWRQPSTGKNIWWAMNGATRLSYGYLLDVPGTAWSMAGTGDFNADGKPDLVWRNSATGQNIVWFMNGTARTSYALLTTVPPPFEIGGIGDFDKDGDADILWRNGTTGQNILWTMNGTTRVSYAPITSVVGPEWRIGGTGDFDKDGDADIIWRNGTTGQNVIWFMNGATRTSYASTLTVVGAMWRIQAVADYDGDGDADLFWRNVTSGQNIIWFMNGATRTSYAPTLTITDASFEAQSPK